MLEMKSCLATSGTAQIAYRVSHNHVDTDTATPYTGVQLI